MGHESTFSFGSPAVLNCTTDLAIDTIEWLDTRGNILKNGSDPVLELKVVPSDSGSLTYTCIIKSKFGIQTKNITLTVQLEASSVISGAAIPATIAVIMLAVLILAVIAASMLVVRYVCYSLLIFQ